MLKKNMTFLCCFMMLLSIGCFANEVACSSIEKIEGQKAYLKPGSIQIAKNGIFINIDGVLVAINHLNMDEKGVYFDIDKYASKICSQCGFSYIEAYCPRCYPGFPIKGWN